ncbi:MAG: hypothetical protein L6V95_14855 [Candidatus Melainabacteria bacterium]|nr:MAG: hypothetical protein L6V95_14855 [Candidatus Melainabacteria bacterium]
MLVNSNPATIMTDEMIADKVYIEPLTLDSLTKIIKKEKTTRTYCLPWWTNCIEFGLRA